MDDFRRSLRGELVPIDLKLRLILQQVVKHVIGGRKLLRNGVGNAHDAAPHLGEHQHDQCPDHREGQQKGQQDGQRSRHPGKEFLHCPFYPAAYGRQDVGDDHAVQERGQNGGYDPQSGKDILQPEQQEKTQKTDDDDSHASNAKLDIGFIVFVLHV